MLRMTSVPLASTLQRDDDSVDSLTKQNTIHQSLPSKTKQKKEEKINETDDDDDDDLR